MKKILISFYLILLSIPVLVAQNKISPLITDRPTQSAASSTVTKGSLQMEAGVLEEIVSKSESNSTFPGVLLRFGLSDAVELRVGGAYQESSRTSYSSDLYKGFSPLLLGAKLYVCEENGLFPEVAVLSEFTIGGTGEEAYYQEYMGTRLLFAFSHTLTDRLSLGYNLGAEYDGSEPRSNVLYSLVVGAALTDWLGGFVEFYGASRSSSQPDNSVDAGFSFLLTKNLQLDLSSGFGVAGQDSGFFLGLGASYRFMGKQSQ